MNTIFLIYQLYGELIVGKGYVSFSFIIAILTVMPGTEGTK